ncbi:ATP-dependent DNA helicase Rep [Pseudomonas fluorescens]|uniref:DNA 3'-5' helicase n=1 Tax=Pseudomonas fluorescens TaxID=294 RepID=A0A5E7DKR5_PSEFL|nr:UvrD-helicase domain-containing protein [Pseudomonas fluorescens]VVO18139.1 ATP-dependent DNA helicase Rep [Pseudomonas fluorescens]
MNPFDRARRKAMDVRESLVGLADSQAAVSSVKLLANAEEILGVAIERVPPTHSILGGTDGVLKRNDETLFIRKDVGDAEAAYLIAHELGHWFLDANLSETTYADLQALTASEGSEATVKIDAYGAHERTELQANVFARELLLPRSVAKQQYLATIGASQLAHQLTIPLEVVRQQLFDGLLLPILPTVMPSALPEMTYTQRVAAHAEETFVNVVAGPGTGKTTTLVHRIKHLLEQGVPASKIVVLTFTNKAAAELIERLAASGINNASNVWAGTFHAFGLEFLRKHHDLFNLSADVSVADKLMQVRLMVACLAKVRLKYYLRLQNPYDWLPDVIEHIKRLKEECLTVDDYRARLQALPACDQDIQDEREDIATLFEAYEEAMHKERWVDYVDLVAFPSIQARRARSTVSGYFDQFEHVLVDEYQDVTEVMVELIRQLALNAASVWVVGDVRQAIHHWRGSSIRSLIEFDKTFKSLRYIAPTYKRYALDLNRRSTPEILDLFSCAGTHHALHQLMPLETVTAYRPSIGEIPRLYQCDSNLSQAATLEACIRTLAAQGIPYREQLVISRSSTNIDQMVDGLRKRGIPILHLGDICQRHEIKRLFCLMELLCMRQPRSLVGLMNDPRFPMTVQDIELLMRVTRKGSGTELQRGRWIWKDIPGLSQQGQLAKANLGMLLHGFTRNTKPWIFVATLMLDRRYGFPDPNDLTIEAHSERLALWLFVYAVRNGDGDATQARLTKFLLREELRRRIGEKLADRGMPPEVRALDAVNVMTVHSSKGLEYTAVHLTNVDDTAYGPNRPFFYDPRPLELIPPVVLNSTDDEFAFEERVERNNLLYVALSRARDHLYLYQLADTIRPAPLNAAGKKLRVLNGIRERAVPPAPLSPGLSAPLAPVSYEAFVAYMNCPLQYHYRHELALTAEQEIDVSIRARWAVTEMMFEVAKNGAVPQEAFQAAWRSHFLPLKTEDPQLYEDAVTAAKRGLVLQGNIGGNLVEGLVSEVGGLLIGLPWMLMTGSELHWIRAHEGQSNTMKHLRPMMVSLNSAGVRRATIYSLITDKQISEGASRGIDRTTVYKMAKRFIAGDRSANQGKSCSRCAYLSICNSQP